jgi:hypothetical protein
MVPLILEVSMADTKLEEKNYAEQRETGVATMLIGGLCWAFAFLVMFFQPAAARLGKLTLIEIAGALVVVGTIVFFVGLRIKRRAME